VVYELELAIFGAAIGLVTPISIYLAKKMIEPIFDVRELISKVVYSMNYYANIYSNPANTARHHEVSDILRKLASELMSKSILLKYPQIPAFFRFIPSKANIEQASRELTGIHNMMFDSTLTSEIARSSEKVAKLLKL
jgi:hypothetical protein